MNVTIYTKVHQDPLRHTLSYVVRDGERYEITSAITFDADGSVISRQGNWDAKRSEREIYLECVRAMIEYINIYSDTQGVPTSKPFGRPVYYGDV